MFRAQAGTPDLASGEPQRRFPRSCASVGPEREAGISPEKGHGAAARASGLFQVEGAVTAKTGREKKNTAHSGKPASMSYVEGPASQRFCSRVCPKLRASQK